MKPESYLDCENGFMSKIHVLDGVVIRLGDGFGDFDFACVLNV